MSIFRNAFDWFACYTSFSVLENIQLFSYGELDLPDNDLKPELEFETGTEQLYLPAGFDPFTSATEVYGFGGEIIFTDVPLEVGPAESLTLSPNGLESGADPLLGPSPADAWLSGAEWDGHFSHGTMDMSGQGNDVITVFGEVLDLPPY